MGSIAVYAPIKPPDHPIASGDRLIARNLMASLELAGLNPKLASSYIAYSKRPGDEYLKMRREGAVSEIEKVFDALMADPPSLWLTYHPYCKAPDWIGPQVSKRLGIPYVTLEACRTGQGRENGQDLWAAWRAEAQAGLKQADLHLCFKPTDKAYLIELLGKDAPIADLVPFFDAVVPPKLPSIERPSHWRDDVPQLVTTGMLRPGKKVKNYKILANALRQLQTLHWNLVLIGGGPEEETIREFFADFDPARLHWTGAIGRDEVLSWMSSSDLFVWPGWREPIGMVYLEAQLMGLPVAALESMGVPLVVEHGVSGLLAQECQPEENPVALRDNIATLLAHPSLRKDFGTAACKRVHDHHSLEAASVALKKILSPLMV